MTEDLISARRRARGRSLPDEPSAPRGARRWRWALAVALVGTTIIVTGGIVWYSQKPRSDAQLLVREEAQGDAVAPLDGREITGPAEVSVGTDGDIDAVAYRLVGDDGRIRFAGKAWSPPFTLSAAAEPDAGPLSAGGLPPGGYLLTATVGFADGGKTEVTAAFTIATQAAVRPPSEAQESADEEDGLVEAEGDSDAQMDSGPPGAHSTGPRIPDDQLRPSERLVVTEDGAVVEGLDIAGTLVIDADDVMVRDTRVRSSAPYPVRAMPGTSGTLIEYVQVDGQHSLDNNSCITGANVTVRHSELRRCVDGAKIESGSTYERNWIHDPTRDASGAHDLHVDGLQSTGGHGIVIRGNHIEMIAADGHLSNSAIILKSDFGAIKDCLIEGNWLNGGNYTIYLRDGGHGPPTGCVVRGNRFGRDYQYGLLSIDGDVSQSANVWDEDGSPVQE